MTPPDFLKLDDLLQQAAESLPAKWGESLPLKDQLHYNRLKADLCRLQMKAVKLAKKYQHTTQS